MNVTADNLDQLMEFDCVIQVHDDGTVTDAPEVWAPELTALSDFHGYHTADTDPDLQRQAEPFSLETGWTGQYNYNGPCMHASEFVGRAMADHILETPGYWVVVLVGEEGEYIDGDYEPAEAESWALAYCSVDEYQAWMDERTAQFARIMERHNG